MDSTTDPDLKHLVLRALRQAARTGEPHRLTAPRNGKAQKALFPSGKGVHQRAIDLCLNVREPLLQLEPRARSNQARHARPTASGLRELLLHTLSEKRGELIRTSAPEYRPVLLDLWMAASAEQSEAWRTDFEHLESCAREHGVKLPPGASSSSPQTPPVSKLTPAEADFKRSLAHELVISWKFTTDEEARKGIARALRNTGVTQIGNPGEALAFVGRHHRCEEPVFPGDPVVIVEPGWMVFDGIGEFLLEKAVVRPV